MERMAGVCERKFSPHGGENRRGGMANRYPGVLSGGISVLAFPLVQAQAVAIKIIKRCHLRVRLAVCWNLATQL